MTKVSELTHEQLDALEYVTGYYNRKRLWVAHTELMAELHRLGFLTRREDKEGEFLYKPREWGNKDV